jgi:hypothetical protein
MAAWRVTVVPSMPGKRLLGPEPTIRHRRRATITLLSLSGTFDRREGKNLPPAPCIRVQAVRCCHTVPSLSPESREAIETNVSLGGSDACCYTPFKMIPVAAEKHLHCAIVLYVNAEFYWSQIGTRLSGSSLSRANQPHFQDPQELDSCGHACVVFVGISVHTCTVKKV